MAIGTSALFQPHREFPSDPEMNNFSLSSWLSSRENGAVVRVSCLLLQ